MQLISESSHDRTAFPAFKRFMEFLAAEPTPQSICQHLVLNWPFESIMNFAGLRVVTPDATLALTGFFGAHADRLRPYLVTSLWEDAPASRAIRDRVPAILADRAAVERNNPEGAGEFPDFLALVAIPLVSSFNAVGTLEVAFANELTNFDDDLEFLSLCSNALTLYGKVFTNNHTFEPIAKMNGHARTKDSHVREPKEVQDQSLTSRQLSILELMSLQFTNRRIASRLGYSESTIRQETMAIYSYFNVRTRKEAVEQAIIRGVIKQLEDEFQY